MINTFWKTETEDSDEMQSIYNFLTNWFKSLKWTNELKIKIKDTIVIARGDQCLIRNNKTHSISILN